MYEMYQSQLIENYCKHSLEREREQNTVLEMKKVKETNDKASEFLLRRREKKGID